MVALEAFSLSPLPVEVLLGSPINFPSSPGTGLPKVSRPFSLDVPMEIILEGFPLFSLAAPEEVPKEVFPLVSLLLEVVQPSETSRKTSSSANKVFLPPSSMSPCRLFLLKSLILNSFLSIPSANVIHSRNWSFRSSYCPSRSLTYSFYAVRLFPIDGYDSAANIPSLESANAAAIRRKGAFRY